MIGLDTNVLVRFIMQDDPVQSEQAGRVMAGLTAARPGYVSSVTMVELWWVLGRSYGRTQSERCDLFDALVDSHDLLMGDASSVRAALVQARRGADFADGLITTLSQAAGCVETLTFDRNAVRRAGMTLVR
ncbi:MAG: type II toxin-antitoxin system VapC family toxin [Propionibacteriaceae bacterium]|nr:type II toxin-antitoxin system VapC family toxin [Propionibacteriaceae bacterium]